MPFTSSPSFVWSTEAFWVRVLRGLACRASSDYQHWPTAAADALIHIKAIARRAVCPPNCRRPGNEARRPKAAVAAGSTSPQLIRGVTISRGIAGFRRSAQRHGTYRGLQDDLPIVVEIIDRGAEINAWLPTLERLLRGGGV
jgi:hypothetical protein